MGVRYLVEQPVAQPGEQVVQDVVPAVSVELEQVLDDADLDLSTHRRGVLVEHDVRLHFVFFDWSLPTAAAAAEAEGTAAAAATVEAAAEAAAALSIVRYKGSAGQHPVTREPKLFVPPELSLARFLAFLMKAKRSARPLMTMRTRHLGVALTA